MLLYSFIRKITQRRLTSFFSSPPFFLILEPSIQKENEHFQKLHLTKNTTNERNQEQITSRLI